MTTPPYRHVVTHPDRAALADAAAARLLLAVGDAQADHGHAHVVLTGGGIGGETLAAAARSPLRRAVDWSAVTLWWGDDRFLAEGDPQRNATQARAQLLDALALDPGAVHEMPGPDRAGELTTAAQQYADELATAARRGPAGDGSDPVEAGPLPRFDVLLLGVGPEGHVASLFPHSPGLTDPRPVLAVPDSPKPPPQRVSLSLTAINTADEIWLLAAGSEKADAVARALGGAPAAELPVAGVRGRRATRFLLDRDAASGLAG